MSSTNVTLYEQQIFCLTENTFVTLWTPNSALLTTCPNNPAHTVQPNSASLVTTLQPNTVRINKDTVTTNGHLKVVAIPFQVPAAIGGTPGVATDSRSWPINIAIFMVQFAVPAAGVGCTVQADVAPLSLAGVLAAPVSAGATSLVVTPGSLPRVDPGFIVSLATGATVGPGNVVSFPPGSVVTELGSLVTVDHTGGTLTFDTPTAGSFAPGTTLVLIGARPFAGVELGAPGYMVVGEGLTTSLGLPLGTTITTTVTNPGAAPARVILYLHYTY